MCLEYLLGFISKGQIPGARLQFLSYKALAKQCQMGLHVLRCSKDMVCPLS